MTGKTYYMYVYDRHFENESVTFRTKEKENKCLTFNHYSTFINIKYANVHITILIIDKS